MLFFDLCQSLVVIIKIIPVCERESGHAFRDTSSALSVLQAISRNFSQADSSTAAVNRNARRSRSTLLPADVNTSTAAMSETEKFIDLVRERPYLYDMNDPEYKNRPKRLATWKEIASEMGTGNADIWSAKWKGLKDNFAKFKKSTEPPYSENYKKYKNWPWAEHVRFLDECNFTSGRRIRCIPIRANNSIAYVNTEDSNDAEQEVTETRRKRKRHNTEPSEEDQEINYKINKNNISTPDGVDQFFLSYAQSFKKLPSRMQIMLKLEIATLFTRYELQANGVTPESVDNIPRIVPHPVKLEYDFFNVIDD